MWQIAYAIWELIYKLNFKADNITIHPNGRVDISQPVIDSEKKETNQEQLKDKVLQTESESKIDEVSKKEVQSQNKNVDKKQFDWTETLLLMIFIVVFGYKIYSKSKVDF
ncbi:hypothetical protein C8P70_103119 [Myroides indicus]|uniref:Uncharacterized protein n=2 Tax=Myroides indicus TaxID=1323422 RepID=A0A4R7F3T5_9FLAO|nr:hypothetical protein C8P70_103119 [Myroides indicus]